MLAAGQKVEINYSGQLEDGTEFVNTWLMPDSVPVVLGSSGLLPAFERELLGMQRGQRRSFTIPCEEAYGPYDPAGVISVPAEGFPHADELPVGQFIEFNMAGGRGRARVLGIQDGQILFDTNHELAGHDLSFEVELVDDGSSTALDQEGGSSGCGCNRLRESLGSSCECPHHHAAETC
ncbi:MAG: peptidylprolyl isomerase [Coriobacteriales bacterium]